MLESLGDSRLQKLVFRHIPVSSEIFVIEPEREPFRLIPPLYPEGFEKHGPTRLYSASEAVSSVSCLYVPVRHFQTTSYAIHRSAWKRKSRQFAVARSRVVTIVRALDDDRNGCGTLLRPRLPRISRLDALMKACVILAIVVVMTTTIPVIIVARVGTILAKLAIFLLAARIRARHGIALLRRELCAAQLAHLLAATDG